MRPNPGPPATIGTTLDAGLDLTGACTACRRVVIVDTEALEALALRYSRDPVLFDDAVDLQSCQQSEPDKHRNAAGLHFRHNV
jgi:hypothetical protein